MQKDEELMQLHQRRLNNDQYYSAESLLIVYDFYQFCNLVES